MSSIVDQGLPTSIEAVDGAWLTRALREAGRIGPADEVTIERADPVGADSAYAGTLHRLHLAGPPAVPATLILKLPVGGDVRPLLDGIGAYQREIAFYRDVAPQAPHRTPDAWLALQATESTDFVLLLEDMAPLVAADQLIGLGLPQARVAVGELARVHAWSWNHPRLASLAATFPPIDGDRGRAVQGQFAEFARMSWPLVAAQLGDELPPAVRAFGERLPDLIPFFVDELAEPRALTHGELRSDNLFLDGDRSPVLIDFQAVQQEAGVREVAYLVSQSMTVQERRGHDEELVRHYWEGLVAAGVEGYSWDEAWRQYRLAVAYSLYLPAVAFLRYEAASETGRQLLREMVLRAAATIEDVGSLELLPD